MLELQNIRKDYETGSETVRALKGITLTFRKNEYVSILGPSGCGKTTLLNLVGGITAVQMVLIIKSSIPVAVAVSSPS